jgi:hypothetical protein
LAISPSLPKCIDEYRFSLLFFPSKGSLGFCFSNLFASLAGRSEPDGKKSGSKSRPFFAAFVFRLFAFLPFCLAPVSRI